MRIGVPRCLLFHKFYTTWKSFFDTLGFEVITSPMTTEGILKEGIKQSVSDLCLPVKSFLGHVFYLKDEVDCLFIPRYISIEKDAYMCPKCIGLPDVVKSVFPHLPKILSPVLNVKEGAKKTENDFIKTITNFFSIKPDRVKKAWIYASKQNKVQNQFFYADDSTSGFSINIGIVGRSYTVLDNCISKDIIKQLNNLGVNVIYKEPSYDEVANVMKKLPKWIYWSFGKEVVTSAYQLLNDEKIDGVINIVNATCGPDAFTSEIIKRFLKGTNKPYMAMLIDEHTSDVGIQTRVEAFIDMIAQRNPLAGAGA